MLVGLVEEERQFVGDRNQPERLLAVHNERAFFNINNIYYLL